jgi:hypothetical protein
LAARLKSSIHQKMGDEKPTRLMVGNVQWVEWFVEKATAGRGLGNTNWVVNLNQLALAWFL